MRLCWSKYFWGHCSSMFATLIWDSLQRRLKKETTHNDLLIAGFITVTYVHTHTPERLCQHVANLADVTENLSNTASKQKRPAIQVSLCRPWGCGAIKHPSPASIPVFTHPCQPPRSGETLACVLWRPEVI